MWNGNAVVWPRKVRCVCGPGVPGCDEQTELDYLYHCEVSEMHSWWTNCLWDGWRLLGVLCKEKAHLSCVTELFQLCLRCTSAAHPNVAEIVLHLCRGELCLHPKWGPSPQPCRHRWVFIGKLPSIDTAPWAGTELIPFLPRTLINLLNEFVPLECVRENGVI